MFEITKKYYSLGEGNINFVLFLQEHFHQLRISQKMWFMTMTRMVFLGYPPTVWQMCRRGMAPAKTH